MMKLAAVTTLFMLGLHAAAFAAEPAPAAGETAKQAQAKEPPSAAASASEPNSTAAEPKTKARRNTDRLDLDTTVVTGNRELPKVLYIVPWKKADIGDLPSQPFNTLLDEALTPVDRDVFRREVTYYGAVSAGANTAGGAPASQATGPEK